MSLKSFLIKEGLTNREAEISELVSKGLSNRAIGDRLGTTKKRIDFHLSEVYRKLKRDSRAQLVVYCIPHMDSELKEPNIVIGEVTPSIEPEHSNVILDPGVYEIGIPSKKKYEVVVHNSQGSATYMTDREDVTLNYMMGNEPMIRFVTLDDMIVTLPNNVIITQKEFK